MLDQNLRAKLQQAIRGRDIAFILETFFEPKKPALLPGFHYESDLWDFKATAPGHGRANEVAWANIAADVLAFHNREGGILFFGIDDATHSFCGTPTDLDSKKFNDKLRRYVGDAFWVAYSKEFLQKNGLHLGVAIIPRRNFRVQLALAPAATLHPHDKPHFEAGDLCTREGDQTLVLRGDKATSYLNEHNLPSADYKYAVDKPGVRILRPDYRQFVFRKDLCHQVMKALSDEKTFITSLLGFGGLGKTALATWATLETYETRSYDYIISLSAKDRELKVGGIQRVEAELSSFDSLLDTILEVMGFSEERKKPTEKKAESVNGILRGERVLLYVDNLETVDDDRIFRFLEDLPAGIRVLATSRKAKLKRGVYPIDVGAMKDSEALQFFEYCCQRKSLEFVQKFTTTETSLILKACGNAPLLIEWFVANAKTPEAAVVNANEMIASGKLGEELVEFCFRRVHDELTAEGRRALRVISLFLTPMPIEAIAAGAGLTLTQADDTCQDLIDASLIQQDYSEKLHDTVYFMLPVTQKFAYQSLRSDLGAEQAIRKALSRWYEAADVKDVEERKIISEIRKGVRDPEKVLVEYAESMRTNGIFADAEKFYTQALQRNPKSWEALRGLGEIHRHEGRTALALQYYEMAAIYAPKKGPDRALVFREWGMVLRDAGTEDCLRQATEKFEIALKETPLDFVARHALGNMYVRLFAYEKAAAILEPLLQLKYPDTLQKTVPLLKQCYERTHEILKLAELRSKHAKYM